MKVFLGVVVVLLSHLPFIQGQSNFWLMTIHTSAYMLTFYGPCIASVELYW